MPIPRPSSDNYEYPSDAGIMGEDYRLDQLRFKEVTDDELKAFQQKKALPEMVECDCGHACGAAMVMSASMGTSCPDCYDTMSDDDT